MKIIVAIDSFKGCLTSAEANQAAAAGIGSGDGSLIQLAERIKEPSPDPADPILIPVSDGGEGWLEAFHSAMGAPLAIVA